MFKFRCLRRCCFFFIAVFCFVGCFSFKSLFYLRGSLFIVIFFDWILSFSVVGIFMFFLLTFFRCLDSNLVRWGIRLFLFDCVGFIGGVGKFVVGIGVIL